MCLHELDDNEINLFIKAFEKVWKFRGIERKKLSPIIMFYFPCMK